MLPALLFASIKVFLYLTGCVSAALHLFKWLRPEHEPSKHEKSFFFFFWAIANVFGVFVVAFNNFLKLGMLVYCTAVKLRQSVECSVYSGMTVASFASEKSNMLTPTKHRLLARNRGGFPLRLKTEGPFSGSQGRGRGGVVPGTSKPSERWREGGRRGGRRRKALLSFHSQLQEDLSEVVMLKQVWNRRACERQVKVCVEFKTDVGWSKASSFRRRNQNCFLEMYFEVSRRWVMF